MYLISAILPPAYIQDCSLFIGQLAAITKDFEVFSKSFHVAFLAENFEESKHHFDAVKHPSLQFNKSSETFVKKYQIWKGRFIELRQH
jgi:hypothetical protein